MISPSLVGAKTNEIPRNMCCYASLVELMHHHLGAYLFESLGKFEKPQCMKNIKHYPCEHKATKNAWATAEVFRKWLPHLGRQVAYGNRNILLFLSHYSSHNHKKLALKHIQLMHLPLNTTSYVHSLEQGVSCLNMAYQKCLACCPHNIYKEMKRYGLLTVLLT